MKELEAKGPFYDFDKVRSKKSLSTLNQIWRFVAEKLLPSMA